jgi:lysophospholipid acyltransferase (LPLAT)-like uncharacterized protein
MKLKNIFKLPLFSCLISWLIYAYIKLVIFTSKLITHHPEVFDVNKFNSTKAFYLLWHNKIALAMLMKPKKIKTAALISPSNDGKFLSNVIKKFGIETISGSSNKNNLGAIREIMKKYNEGFGIAITPDGPRGPKHKINSSIVKIASKLSAPIYILSYSAKRKITFKSWDNFILPLPFNQIILLTGSPIFIKKNISDEETLLMNNLLEKQLNNLCFRAETEILNHGKGK